MLGKDFSYLEGEGESKNLMEKIKEVGVGELIEKNKATLALSLIGLILIGLGVFLYREYLVIGSDGIEVIEEIKESKEAKNILVVEISGAVEKPGVYKLSEGARVEDLLIAGGGVSAEADRVWLEKYINRAAKLTDGQKIYVPRLGEQAQGMSAKNEGDIKVYQGDFGSDSSNLININTATQKELESLPGIGHVYAQSIIEHRPYSNIEELLSKGALKEYVYKKVKNNVTVY